MLIRRRRLIGSILLFVIAIFAAACGSDAADEVVTTEVLFAPGDDPLDLAVKPPVDDEFLVPVDELIVTDLVEGDGAEAESGSVVAAHYVGVLAADGSQFDASWDRGGEPLVFNLGVGQVIPGWDQGMVGMRVGGRRVLQIPSALAYGDSAPSSAIPANSDLVFIVDLLAAEPAAPPTPTPQPAPPVPEDALGDFTELGIIDLAEGTGRAAEDGDIVTVHYVGVRGDDGEEFDNSWARNRPFVVTAGRGSVIEGWRLGLLGAQAGTERILQIPSVMAYGQGDLVFRVHVESVVEAPLAHTLTFTGEAPSEVTVETLVEGSGQGATQGDVVNASIVVIRHSDGAMLQSSYESDTVAPLFVSEEGLLPGLNDAVIGIKAGETRQVILPIDVAFPDGPPPDAGASSGDALVFVMEAIDLNEGSGDG